MILMVIKEKIQPLPKFFWVRKLPFTIGKSSQSDLFINQNETPTQKIKIDLEKEQLIQVEDQDQTLLRPFQKWNFSMGKIFCISIKSKEDLIGIGQMIRNALLKISLPPWVLKNKKLCISLLSLTLLGCVGMAYSLYSHSKKNKALLVNIPAQQYYSIEISDSKDIGLVSSSPLSSKNFLRFYIPQMKGIETIFLNQSPLPLLSNWQGPRYAKISQMNEDKPISTLLLRLKGKTENQNYIYFGNLEIVEFPSSLNCGKNHISSLPIWNQIDQWMKCEAISPHKNQRKKIQSLNIQLMKKRELLQFHYLQAIHMNLYSQAKDHLQALLHLIPDPKDPFHQKIRRKLNELLQVIYYQRK